MHSITEDQKLLYSARGVAGALDCSVAMAKKLIYDQRIPSLKVGGLRRVRREDLERWIADNSVSVGGSS